MSSPNKQQNAVSLSGFSGANVAYLEDLYNRWQNSPDQVDPHWQHIFQSLDSASPSTTPPASDRFATDGYNAEPLWSPGQSQKQGSVLRLINGYRNLGHHAAKIDPLGMLEPEHVRELGLEHNGLDASDRDQVYLTGSFAAADQMTLGALIESLQRVYCGSIGSEYMHITDVEQKRWIQARIEQHSRSEMDSSQKLHLLDRLTAAEGIERYLHTKYVGQKRFSLEGSESLIPMLDRIIQQSGSQGTKEIVIGMAHRGRLNVLVNTLGKSPRDLFGEFEGTHSLHDGPYSGDVKYHQGFSSDILTPGGAVHLALSFNPSHLEIIDPVVEGSVRARQQRREDKDRTSVLPLLVHGDAAFAGQGVVMETFNMSRTRGYSTGGTIHIVINNQIGFTTSNPLDARSTRYCTEVAKLIQAPILHVNGDDPEAVMFVTELALEFRNRFKNDAVIDLVCYRRHGHNEADEPAVTQPMMYQVIKKQATTREIYANNLIQENTTTQETVDKMVLDYRDALDEGMVVAGQIIDPNKSKYMVDWTPYIGTSWTDPAETGYPHERLQELAKQLQILPEDFEVHARVRKIMSDREKMATGERRCDWGFAENLAYASLIDQGYSVRLSGQDSGRGTFFHRHATLYNQLNRDVLVPLRTIGKKSQFLVINSLLSEEAVLGFEYGYSTTEPDTLVIWEAQFGDFANGAQVVIDQFISSGEAKWGRLSGLTMLLPHGFEGQGPEHSSARLERYLQLCAEHNIQVCTPTTPAQMFHMLRRQVIRKHRKPLIVMSPKSLLRHKESTSTLEELCNGSFLPVIGEQDKQIDTDKVRQVTLCGGKVYYDLLEARQNQQISDVALVRVEQLHSFPEEDLRRELCRYPAAKQIIWCQEEPLNQGAWYQIRHHLVACVDSGQKLRYAGRGVSASPAVGQYKLHMQQQQALINEALANAENINETYFSDGKASHGN